MVIDDTVFVTLANPIASLAGLIHGVGPDPAPELEAKIYEAPMSANRKSLRLNWTLPNLEVSPLRLFVLSLGLAIGIDLFQAASTQAKLSPNSLTAPTNALVAGDSRLDSGEEQGSPGANPKEPSKSNATPKGDSQKKHPAKN
jgi:hypothetical protein